MATTLQRTLLTTVLLGAGTLLLVQVLTAGLFALPPIAVPVALLALAAGLATLPLEVPEGTLDPTEQRRGRGHRPT